MWQYKLILNRFGYLPSNPTNSENLRSGFSCCKVTQTTSSTHPLPHNQFPRAQTYKILTIDLNG